MQGIIDACGKLGMDAAGLKSRTGKIMELKDVAKPVILHLEKKTGWLHFTVLYGLDEHTALMMDPEDGKIHRLRPEALEEEWSGYIIALSPSPMFRKGDRRTDITGRLKELLLYYRKDLLAVLAGSLAYTAAVLSTSVFLQKIIDSVIPSADRKSLVLICAVMLVLAALTWLISYMRSVLLVRTSLKIDCRLITGYFRKIFSLPVTFFDTMGSGELNSRVSDAYRIRSFITGRLLLMAISVITLAVTTAILMTFYWKLALVTLCFVPFCILVYILSSRMNHRLNRSVIERNAAFEQTSVEWLSSARSVRYFCTGREAVRKIEGKYLDTALALYKSGLFTSAVESTSDLISRLTGIVTITAGSFFVLKGDMSIGELASFYTLAMVFCSPIVLLIESTREIAEARISAERIFDILDLEDERPPHETVKMTLSPDDMIEFRDVSFSFPGRMRLLEHLSFKILPGKTNLIRGSNGCGKSTIATLLMRGYLPQEGSITAGGVDIQSIPLETWRKHISIVPQKPELVNGSILENIVMGDEEYDIRDVMAVCAMTGLAGTLESLPGGVMADTGEHACRLSGGERQKIALARALYRKPSVLILDEAATHLDADGRARLAETIGILTERKVTVVMISHDEESAEMADNIIEIRTNAHSQA